MRLYERGNILLNSTLTSPTTVIELPTKSYVDYKVEDPSIIENTTHVVFNDKNLDGLRFFKVNSMPAVREHLTPKYYVDEPISQNVDELSLLRLDPETKLQLDEQTFISLNSNLTSPKTMKE